MPEPIDTTGMMLGELKGQMRELIHQVNTMSAKMDSLTERVVSTAGIPSRIKEIEERLTLLEADKNQRDGAMNFGGWLLRSPLLGWLTTAGVALWALFRGKL
jgi:hypothetical protein